MSWSQVKLGEVCTFINGDRGKNYPSKSAFIEEGIPFINAGNLFDYKIKNNGLNFISREKFDRLSNGKIRKNDFLFCLRGSLGKFALVEKEMEGAIASSLVIIRSSDDITNEYLFEYLRSDLCSQEIEKFGNGAAQPNLSARDLKEFIIPLPPLIEQKRIAAILDKADAIRRKRQQAIDLTDQLLRSVFLDMFGDPVTNPKGFEFVKFGTVGQLDRGKSKHRPRNDPILLGGDHPLIQTGDVAKSGGYITAFKSTYSDVGLKQSKKWPSGTLCITIAANIANTGVLEFDACFPDSVVGFTPNELVTVEYVQTWLGFLQKIIEDAAPESAQKNINLAILRDLEIPLPNIIMQKKFSQIVHQVKYTKGNLVGGEKEIQTLFNSLNQQAFSGELTKQTKAA